VAEIRGKFQQENQINITSINTLLYELAVFKEALRIFPPITVGSPRIVDAAKGEVIDGMLVPGGVSYRSQCLFDYLMN
jgi:hypothetical protein